MAELRVLEEPTLRFGFDQDVVNPKDGLTLFGPYSAGSGGLRYGVIGPKKGIELFRQWVDRVNGFIPAYQGGRFTTRRDSKFTKLVHQPYPGFQAAFGLTWTSQPEVTEEIFDESLDNALSYHELHTRVAKTVKVYAKRLAHLHYESENRPDLWFVIIPKKVHTYCRPLSEAPREYRPGTRKGEIGQFDLFVDRQEREQFIEDYNEALHFKPDFHNQLKARLLKHQILTQVIQDDTLEAGLRDAGTFHPTKQDPATVAWNVTTSIFYKTRRRPWILADPRDGVCYMGLVFKRLDNTDSNVNACCGAQMFLEDGRGMVFKGALGPWYSETEKECHLNEQEAGRLLDKGISSYAEAHDGRLPSEVFIHGSVRFNQAEWRGFENVARARGVRVVGVRIRKLNNDVKLYRRETRPVLRGTRLRQSESKALLWPTGFVPRLNTYPGWDVPNPLDIEICNGQANIDTVCSDILRLTKLNYNSCSIADGMPITLKFARKIGDILTALPQNEQDAIADGRTPLPFWHYI